jgi:hypothetical protein
MISRSKKLATPEEISKYVMILFSLGVLPEDIIKSSIEFATNNFGRMPTRLLNTLHQLFNTGRIYNEQISKQRKR